MNRREHLAHFNHFKAQFRTPRAVAVWRALWERADEDGCVVMSVPDLAQRLGVSVSTVGVALRELRLAGLVGVREYVQGVPLRMIRGKTTLDPNWTRADLNP